MITDTQWLMRALVQELDQAHIADAVTAPNVTTYDAALDALREYPQRVIFVLPGAINMSHDLQGGYPVKATLTREVTLFISAAAPGQQGGDMDTANNMTDETLKVLTWHELGQPGRIICKPRQASPLPLVWEDAPGRAVWTMTVDVTSLENEF